MNGVLFVNELVYPARTLWQPYAGLVELGLKTIETREYRTSLRANLVFCAGLQVDEVALRALRAELVPSRVSAEAFDRATSRRGVAVAIARVTSCRRLTRSDWAQALFWNESKPRWAWLLEDQAALDPFPVRGVPGFFAIPRTDVHEALLR